MKYQLTKTDEGTWAVTYQNEIVIICRAKSRSRVEMQVLLNHMNKTLKEAS